MWSYMTVNIILTFNNVLLVLASTINASLSKFSCWRDKKVVLYDSKYYTYI